MAGDSSSSQVLWEALQEKGPKITAFAVAFVWVSLYWRANHRFTMTLRAMDATYVRTFLLYLGLVALLPLPAALLGEYWNNALAVSLFAVYAAAVSTMEVVLAWIAYRDDLHVAPISREFFRSNAFGSLSPVVAFLLSIPIAFWVGPMFAIIFWFVGAVITGTISTKFLAASAPPDDLRSPQAAD